MSAPARISRRQPSKIRRYDFRAPRAKLCAMIYLTQLIYLKPGGEAAFEEFEAHAIPIIARYGGELVLRIRPTADTVIEAAGEVPYEIHVVSFPSADAFEDFKRDEERKRFLHLKEESVREVLLVEGRAV